MHPNEEFLTRAQDSIQWVRTLTELAIEAHKLGQPYVDAMGQQLLRLNILIPSTD
jgi:hypothetical protein